VLADSTPVTSSWCDAAKLKVGEQAAAELLLQRLPAHESVAQPAGANSEPPVSSALPPSDAGRTAAMAINELCQAGVLRAASYDLVDQSGPSHQPVFTVVAWATTPEGHTFRTEPVEAPSKKGAQRQAAERLLDLLVTAGLSRR
jgi:hypothetical protein